MLDTPDETSQVTYEQLCKSLARLSPREEKIIRLRYGIGEDHPHTYKELAHQFSTDAKDIYETEKKALQKLQCPFPKPKLVMSS